MKTELTTVLRDVAIGVRSLRQRPGFATAAIVSLALGVGANTATFSVVNAALFAPLPFRDAAHLVALARRDEAGGTAYTWSYPRYRDIARAGRAFSATAAFTQRELPSGAELGVEQVTLEAVSEGYFGTLGVAPMLGSGADFRENGPPVALMSASLWRARFGSDPNIVGSRIEINQYPLVVIGVLPDGFRGQSGRVDVWTPADVLPELTGDHTELSELAWQFHIVARLRPGVSIEVARQLSRSAEAELNGGTPRPASRGGVELRIMPLRDTLVTARLRHTLVLLLIAAACVLLAACVNVATLMLLRIEKARRDIAVRAALGATPARIARLFVTESLVLALVGTAAALPLAVWCTTALWALRPATGGGMWGMSLAFVPTPRLDGRVMLVTIVSALAAGLGCGLVPTVLASNTLTRAGLNMSGAGSASAGGRRTLRIGPRGWLASVQVALALVLVISAGLLIRSMLNLERTDLGFQPRGILTAGVDLPKTRYTAASAAALSAALIERARTLPGVDGATFDVAAPLSPGRLHTAMTITAGAVPGEGGPGTQMGFHAVGPDYFRVLDIPIVAGRPFEAADFAFGAPPRVIVSKSAERRFWDGRDPIGSHIESILFVGLGPQWSSAEVVGVAEDVKFIGAEADPEPEVYAPFAASSPGTLALLVRSRSDPALLAGALRGVVRELDPALPLHDVVTLNQVVEGATAPLRFNAILLSFYGLIALSLALIGIYSVIGVETALRTQEIGIRMALGASPRQVLLLLLRDGVRLALLGTAMGIPAAVLSGQMLRSQLYQVTSVDVPVYASIVVLLVVVAAIASLTPARRASRIDPVTAIRAD